jgi:hypothetical protein
VTLGPFRQVCFESELVGPTTRTLIRDIVTRNPIVQGYGGFWYHDDHPYKQAFVRAAAEGER